MIHIPTDGASSAITEALKRYLRKKFPYIPDNSIAVGDWISFSTQYKKWNRITTVVIVAWFFIAPVIWGWILYAIYCKLYGWFTPKGGMFFPCEWAAFVLPGIFVAAFFAAQVMEWTQRLLLKKEYEVFIDYHNIKEQYDSKKANRFFKRIFIYPLMFCLLLSFTTSLTTMQQNLSFRRFYDYRIHTYTYGEISKVSYFLNFVDNQGYKMPNPHYKIKFKDNTEFASNWYFGEAAPAAQFVKILLSRGVPIDTVEIDK